MSILLEVRELCLGGFRRTILLCMSIPSGEPLASSSRGIKCAYLLCARKKSLDARCKMLTAERL